MDYIYHYRSPLGPITLASDGQALVGLWFDGQKNWGSTLATAYGEADLPMFRDALWWLESYFAGQDPGFTPALALRGTPFRRSVWQNLLAIPFGETRTYGELARSLGMPGAAQAVGSAVGHNPISLIVPCHRVVGADGGLTGYAGGLEKKAWLLRMEAAALIKPIGSI